MTRVTGLVLAAAGRGSRFADGLGTSQDPSTSENKIWAPVGQRPLLEWTLEAFQAHPEIQTIVVVGASGELNRLRTTAEAFSKVSAVVRGGASRAESVGNGLRVLPRECEIALVHDAARPAVSAALISRVIEGVRRHGAAVPGLPVSDTVKRVDADERVHETVPRNSLRTVQTPQGARLSDLLSAYERLGPDVASLTDEAAVLESAGFPVRIVEGEERNLKVTRPGDLQKAEAALGLAAVAGLQGSETRTGLGYDVHSFADSAAGRDLWLGGVRIPHDRGLQGHSDADVMLHAVCDALLGAAGMGDIGVLFPDTDVAHKDRRSIEFLEEVCTRLTAELWSVVNVDITLLAEAPRIGPHRTEMIAALAGGLKIAPSRINLKATTSEGMGFVGRREGIACWAVATLARSIT
jgi:2-C-methyl-D-erythritol 4-phosphate cytidylyltransferase/2-C-methyl-D-erythritol 2,4-cyclodiphosphate synthase